MRGGVFAEIVDNGNVIPPGLFTAAVTAVSAAVALFFAWLMARDRLRHDEKLIRLAVENEQLKNENRELRKRRSEP